jgi:hypothetical protein
MLDKVSVKHSNTYSPRIVPFASALRLFRSSSRRVVSRVARLARRSRRVVFTVVSRRGTSRRVPVGGLPFGIRVVSHRRIFVGLPFGSHIKFWRVGCPLAFDSQVEFVRVLPRCVVICRACCRAMPTDLSAWPRRCTLRLVQFCDVPLRTFVQTVICLLTVHCASPLDQKQPPPNMHPGADSAPVAYKAEAPFFF